MTLNEFKAWLEGYEEAFLGDPPDEEQWKKIKEKIQQVSPHIPNGPSWRDIQWPTNVNPLKST